MATCKSRPSGTQAALLHKDAAIPSLRGMPITPVCQSVQAIAGNTAIDDHDQALCLFVDAELVSDFTLPDYVPSNCHKITKTSAGGAGQEEAVVTASEDSSLNEIQWNEIIKSIEKDNPVLLKELVKEHAGSQHTLVSVNEIYRTLSSHQQNRGQSFLHKAAEQGSIRVTQVLLSAGVDTHSLDNDNYTPFHVAMEYHKLNVAEYLLQKGANVDAKDKKGQTALHRICTYTISVGEQDILEAIDFLMNHSANIDAEDDSRWTPLCYAAQSGQKLGAETFLKALKRIDSTTKDTDKIPLMTACEWHSSTAVAVIDTLLTYGADVNLCREAVNGRTTTTALAIACRVSYLSKPVQEEIVLQLLAAGADPDLGAEVALENAVRFCNASIVKALLDAQADPTRLSNKCIKMLYGTHERSNYWTYIQRKEKFALLQQHSPGLFQVEAEQHLEDNQLQDEVTIHTRYNQELE